MCECVIEYMSCMCERNLSAVYWKKKKKARKKSITDEKNIVYCTLCRSVSFISPVAAAVVVVVVVRIRQIRFTFAR